MERKPCSLCSAPADFSLAFHLSTVGQRPRKQKCTQTVLLCNSCIHDASDSLALSPLEHLQQPLTSAYTRFTAHARSQSDPVSQSSITAEAHQGGECGVCCRPRLIACNSRHYDEASRDRDDR